MELGETSKDKSLDNVSDWLSFFTEVLRMLKNANNNRQYMPWRWNKWSLTYQIVLQ